MAAGANFPANFVQNRNKQGTIDEKYILRFLRRLVGGRRRKFPNHFCSKSQNIMKIHEICGKNYENDDLLVTF